MSSETRRQQSCGLKDNGYKERAILIQVSFPPLTPTDTIAEFKQLVISAGIDVIDIFVVNRKQPEATFFIGSGKVKEIAAEVTLHQITVVIVNHFLSPSQERNLTNAFNCCVVSRVGLILDIFAQRARTFEGRLQVELAQLQHLSTRLIRGWTHLERQKGGIGLRGPGETQLETDRRLIRQRIKHLNKKLLKLRAQRKQARATRRKHSVPTIALVGYTNAGKSSLFNRLSDTDVYAADQLFATLDPTVRSMMIPHYGKIIVADTVGFIQDLPPSLIDAFCATLEETIQADLLVHVIDIHSQQAQHQIIEVESILHRIGAADIPRIKAFNKIDLLADCPVRAEHNEQGQVTSVWISTLGNQGIHLLIEAIAQQLQKDFVTEQLIIPPKLSSLRAQLFQRNVIQKEAIDEQGNFVVDVSLASWELKELQKLLTSTVGHIHK